jgi:hypothetical protein
MKTKILTTILIVVVSSITKLHAQDEPQQAINICAVAIPVMNMYVVNYEYLYHEHHGLATRIEYVPNLIGANTKGTAWAVVLDYRWHFSPKLNGFFVGPYARNRYAYGSGTAEGIDYNFKLPEIHVGINGGYRWVSKIGINVVFAWGYGYSFSNEILSPSNSDISSTFNAFKNAEGRNNMIFDAPFNAEFSIGYAF